MKQFEFLPHTADIRLKVFGKTQEELFQNAMFGMAEILKAQSPNPKAQKRIKAHVYIKSQDINSLLVDFLSEVLYQSQINKAVYHDVNFLKFSDEELEAEILGDKVKSFGEDIKAVTYHELEIKKNQDGFFETIIVFDI